MYPIFFKRILDAVGAFVLMVGLSWLFVLIALAYLFTFHLPLFFRQNRIGKDERSFMLWKFRTLKNNDAALRERTFLLGNLMRATSLDELPQLWNVLKGEMSFIGPRPLPVGYLPLFSREQRVRHAIRPGITGWAQVNGRHGISWPEKFRLDAYYVRNVSFGFDLKILWQTVRLLISFKPDVSLVEKPFTGER